jgi:acetyl-CoA acetyltransferase
VLTDRTSNGPHLVYPRSNGAVESETWVYDNFERDPLTGESMLTTAERVAREGGFSKAQLDALTVRRYEQYAEALAGDRAFQRRWMVGFDAGRRVGEVTEDAGIRPATAEGLEGLKPVQPDGVVSYGSQTHPADGTAGMIVTTAERADGPSARILASGFARVAPGTMPKAPVPAAAAALHDAGLQIGQIDLIKSHNPFVVNDLWFARETGVDAEAMNPYGCSLIYGHPQGPTGARAIVELIHALAERGGGRGLFAGCAAGDTGAALVVEVG